MWLNSSFCNELVPAGVGGVEPQAQGPGPGLGGGGMAGPLVGGGRGFIWGVPGERALGKVPHGAVYPRQSVS